MNCWDSNCWGNLSHEDFKNKTFPKGSLVTRDELHKISRVVGDAFNFIVHAFPIKEIDKDTLQLKDWLTTIMSSPHVQDKRPIQELILDQRGGVIGSRHCWIRTWHDDFAETLAIIKQLNTLLCSSPTLSGPYPKPGIPEASLVSHDKVVKCTRILALWTQFAAAGIVKKGTLDALPIWASLMASEDPQCKPLEVIVQKLISGEIPPGKDKSVKSLFSGYLARAAKLQDLTLSLKPSAHPGVFGPLSEIECPVTWVAGPSSKMTEYATEHMAILTFVDESGKMSPDKGKLFYTSFDMKTINRKKVSLPDAFDEYSGEAAELYFDIFQKKVIENPHNHNFFRYIMQTQLLILDKIHLPSQFGTGNTPWWALWRVLEDLLPVVGNHVILVPPSEKQFHRYANVWDKIGFLPLEKSSGYLWLRHVSGGKPSGGYAPLSPQDIFPEIVTSDAVKAAGSDLDAWIQFCQEGARVAKITKSSCPELTDVHLGLKAYFGEGLGRIISMVETSPQRCSRSKYGWLQIAFQIRQTLRSAEGLFRYESEAVKGLLGTERFDRIHGELINVLAPVGTDRPVWPYNF